MSDSATIAKALDMKRDGKGFVGNCPACGYQGFTARDERGRTLVKCHAGGCDQKTVIAALRKAGLWGGRDDGDAPAPTFAPKAKADQKTPEDRTRTAAWIWQQTVPAAGTPVETYLRTRGFTTMPIPPTLRFHPSLYYADGERHPGMVGAVRIFDKLVAVHRTWLRPDGSGKADVPKAKKSLGPVGGGAVYLGRLPEGGVLVVGEGIETSLSVMQATGYAAWAALSAGGIQALKLPPVSYAPEIIIAADNDPPGLRAAHTAARAWHREGRRVRVVVPPDGDNDFNDTLRRGAA